MKVLAFAASNSAQSINKMLVTYAAQTLKEAHQGETDIEILDLNDYEMPIFSKEREENSGIPRLAQEFFDKIGNADAVMISFAEHNGSYAACYKNIFDWMSRIDSKVFQQKPVVMFSTSPGKAGGASVLKSAVESAPFFAADVRAYHSVGQFHVVFDVKSQTMREAIESEAILTATQTLL